MKEDLGVALVKTACPICGKMTDDHIILGNVLDSEHAEKINSMNGKCIGYAEKPCEECQNLINEGCFFIIGIDTALTDDYKNPYRSGHLIGIRRDSDFVQGLEDKYKTENAVFMDYKTMVQLFGSHIFENNTEKTQNNKND